MAWDLKTAENPWGFVSRREIWQLWDYMVSYGPETIFNHQCPMTLTFDLLTLKSIGHILDKWGASAWSFMIIGGLQGQLWSGNGFQSSMPHDLDLWPFDPEINRAHPWLMGSMCMKFHDHRWITESVMVRKLFIINHAPWPWPLILKIIRAHPWLMGSKCM